MKPLVPVATAMALAFGAAQAQASSAKARRVAAGRVPMVAQRTLGYAPIVLGEPGPRYCGEPISLDLKDADLRDVLRTFSQLTKLNIAIDPEVRGSVTVNLKNVPWDQALDLILKTNGFGYVLEGNVVRVGTPAKLGALP